MSESPQQKSEALAEPFEGFRNYPYQDSAGVWTIGFGSTHDADGHPITAAYPPITLGTARAWLQRDMASAFATIAADVHVPLTDNEKAALADFIYNLGAGAFMSSTLLRLINAGQYAAAAGEFEKWDHAGGVVLAGLLRRRLAEKALFQAPG